MLAWSESYVMGIPELDHEHRNLFKIAEKILEQVNEYGQDKSTRMFAVREGLKYFDGYFA